MVASDQLAKLIDLHFTFRFRNANSARMRPVTITARYLNRKKRGPLKIWPTSLVAGLKQEYHSYSTTEKRTGERERGAIKWKNKSGQQTGGISTETKASHNDQHMH